MPSKQYTALETAFNFTDSGSVTLTLNNLGYGAGRVSARYDKGSGSKADLYLIQGCFQLNTDTSTTGEAIEIYVFKSDGTDAEANVGTSDAALTSMQRQNGSFVGCAITEVGTATVSFNSPIYAVYIPTRYFSIGVWNGSGSGNLKASNNTNHVNVTPAPPEMQ